MHDEDIATVIALTLPDLESFRERHGDENKNVTRSQRILRAPGSILLSVSSRMTN
jgi:hypothetical protein